ncbi:MAG: hypothetical protein J6Z11_04635 [Candidatus Riflebacteria bacterium]|nr:hypothetical protein [Candidatus Riflebacteria bacterium]
MPNTNNTSNQQENKHINNNNKSTNSSSTSTPSDSKEVKEEKPAEDKEPEPTLEEDYKDLKEMNLLRNVMVRMQYGKYPNKKINAILQRRMNFDESKYQGTPVVRIIISIMADFFICTFIYVAIWLIASTMNLNDLKETSSLVISLFFLCSCSFLIFNNLSVPDEKKLKEAIKERMNEIEKELKIDKKDNDNKPEKQS